MIRLVLATALCAPIAGLAVTLDAGNDDSGTITEIRVPADRLAECRATLEALEAQPVFTDNGTFVPGFLAEDDLPRTVCVLDA
jgi:hypothetical protein